MADMLRASTVDPISSGLVENNLTEAQRWAMLKIEFAVRRLVAVGARVPHVKLVNELARMGFDQRLVDRTLDEMVRYEEMVWTKERSCVYRKV